MKRSLSAAFSSRDLLDEEKIIQQYVVRFVEKVSTLGNTSRGLKMTKWYEMISFDISGEMVFGESFHSTETGMLLK